jgi:uncharacterized phage-associated protein
MQGLSPSVGQETVSAGTILDGVVVSARDVAAALRERLPALSQTKEHKLLYYCQGHHLATFDEPLFREAVSAWDLGPVVGEFWHAENEGELPGSADALNEAELNTVGYVVSRYGKLTATDLVKLTHAEDPWQTANRNRRPKTSVRIRNEWMRDYFRENLTDDSATPLDSDAVTRWLDEAAVERADRPEPQPDTRDAIIARLRRA